MATVADIIASARYDLRDYRESDLAEEELVDYCNRVVSATDSILSSLNSDLLHQSSTAVTLASGDTSTDAPDRCLAIKSVYYSTEELQKKSIDAIYERRIVSSYTGKPNWWAHVGALIEFDCTADADYALTVVFNQGTAAVTVNSTMPYGGIMNDAIRQGIVLIASGIREKSMSAVSGMLYELMRSAAMQNIIRRNFVPKTYRMDF